MADPQTNLATLLGPNKSLTEYTRENTVPDSSFARNTNWHRAPTIGSAKWNEVFPYQLQIVQPIETTQDRWSISEAEYKDFLVGGGARSSYEVVKIGGVGAVYTLPIPPESIEVTTPFAIQTSITLGGSIEEHNGAPIRQISLSGSLGVAFGRAQGQSLPEKGILDSIIAGTLEAAGRTASAFTKLFNPNARPKMNIHEKRDFEELISGDPTSQARLTGYYQARVLQNFLEAYAELKRSADPNARKYRLAFCMWKDEAVYLVTPLALQIKKAANSPLEYLFALQLKATKRISLSDRPGGIGRAGTALRKPGLMAQILGAIQNAREVLDAARSTVLAVGGDIDATLFQTIRTLSRFAKEALGLPVVLEDVSHQFRGDWKRTKAEVTSTEASFRNFSFDNGIDDPEGLVADPDLDLSHQFLLSKEREERQRAREMTPSDFREHRATVQKAILALSLTLGLGHPTFEATYGLKTSPDDGVNQAGDEDFQVLFALNKLVQGLSLLTMESGNTHPLLGTLATMAGLAERSGIAFQVPRSKFSVPFPYGSTLEMLSQRYLGTPDRWHELAALNGLRSPYVDEEGSKLRLLVNGEGSSVMVDDVMNLFVGKTVWIGSTSTFRTRRQIQSIEALAPNQYLVTVDGDPDMDRYFTIADAYLFAFASHTVNSQQTIFIPSFEQTSEDGFRSSKIPGVDAQEPFLEVGGVDLLLTPTGDLVVTPDGDTRWAVGLTNITQKIRLALLTRSGTLLHHPEYGLPIEAGMSIAEVSPAELVNSVQGMFQDDPSFAGVKAAQVRIEGPVARLSVGVEVSGVGTVIPVSMDVRQ